MPDEPKRKRVKTPTKYPSAAEQLQTLLPKLTALAKATCGTAKQHVWRPIYLDAMRHCANVTIAAQVAGVSRTAVADARRDPEFAAAEREAREAGIDLVEASAFKSAVYGDLEPVYHAGQLVGHVVKYSDAMRALLLRGRRGDVFRDRTEHSGAIEVRHLTLEEAAQRLAESDAGPEETQ